MSSSQAAPRNRWAVWGLVCSILALHLCWVPFIGLALGLVAAAVAARAWSVAQRTFGGRGLAVAGLIISMVSAAVGGIRSAQFARDLFGSVTAAAKQGTITVEGTNSGFLFARSGDTWAASWVSKRVVGTGQLDIELYCRHELYLALFDARLTTTRRAPMRLVRQECSPNLRHALFATSDGFGVVYSRGEKLELALFDLKKMALASPKPLAPATSQALSSNGLFGHRLSITVHDGRVQLALLSRVDAHASELRVIAEAGGRQTELLRVPMTGRATPVYDGYFDGPTLVAWTQPGRVGYAFSADGRRFERRESELRVMDTDNLDLRVLRAGQELAICLHQHDEIWEQRFRLDGTPLHPPKLLVKEGVGLHNFSAAYRGADCVVTYTKGDAALQLYSCATGKSRSLGEHWNTAMECAGGACVRSSKGSTFELFTP